eukprot:jgi/Mesen1/8210/ME000442S07489
MKNLARMLPLSSFGRPVLVVLFLLQIQLATSARRLPEITMNATDPEAPTLKISAAADVVLPKLVKLELDNGLGQTPQMGWNSWNRFGCNIDEELIKSTADTLVSSGLAALGYNHLNLDDCWAELTRDTEGRLTARNSTFPSGMKALGDYIHGKNLSFGIYSDAGFFTCARQPGSLYHEKTDAETFASWGVDYLKYDNCFDDLTPPKVRYPKMQKALNETGRPIFFSMCEWGVENPALWAPELSNSWRTTVDIKDQWDSMIGIADWNNLWADYAGPGGWNDPDMLEVGNGGMSTSEYRVHFSLWALMKAPLLIGCDITNMTEDTKTILFNKEIIAVNQDALGVQGKKVKQTAGSLEVWAGPLTGDRVVVALVNRGTKTANISAAWSDVGLPSDASVTARDLWQGKTLPNALQGLLSAIVESHDVALYVLTPATTSSSSSSSVKPSVGTSVAGGPSSSLGLTKMLP